MSSGYPFDDHQNDESLSPGIVSSGVDLDRIEAAVREILLAVGEDPDREGMRRTPERVAKSYAELFPGCVRIPGGISTSRSTSIITRWSCCAISRSRPCADTPSAAVHGGSPTLATSAVASGRPEQAGPPS